MTGEEGSRKNIWRAQINFTLTCGREDQKKGLHSDCLHSFGAQVSLVGEGGTFIARRGVWNLMVWISLLVHKFSGKDQKKGGPSPEKFSADALRGGESSSQLQWLTIAKIEL